MSAKKYLSNEERLEVAKLRMRKTRARDPVANRLYAAQWRKNNPEKAKEHSRRTRLKNAKKIRASQKEWYEKNKERISEKSKQYYGDNKNLWRDYNLKKNFGISLEQFNDLLKKQKGRCAICLGDPGARGKLFAVDHCHKTGRVRGILCRGCNVGIGNLRDDPKLLERAAAYLRKNV